MTTPAGPRGAAFSPHRGALLTLVVLLATLLALAAGGWRVRAFLSGQTDLGSYFIPKYQYAADRIAAGELPLWNPYEFAGIPFLATIQPGVFYPPLRAVYALLSGEDAYMGVFLLHLLIGSLGALLFARDLGVGLWPAVFAAAWVTQPMWLVRLYDHPVLVSATVWIPLLLLASRRLVRRPSARGAAGLGLVAALQALSGYPPLVLATAYVLALGMPFWLLEHDAAAGRPPIGRVVGSLIGASALALLIAAVQILPTLELALLTDRATEAERTRALLASLADLGDDTLLFMGIPPTSFAASVAALWQRCGPFLLAPALLAPILRPRSGAVWFAVSALVLTACLPSWAYAYLPFSSFVRFGVEWLFISTFVAYLLAALGLDALFARLPRARPFVAPAALALLALATFTSWRLVDPRWLELDFATPPPLPGVAQLCDLHDPRYRGFWTTGQVRGSLMNERVRSPTGFEQSLLPSRVAAVQQSLGIGNGIVLPGWARSVADNVRVASRLSLRCIVTPPAPVLKASGFTELPSSDAASPRVYVNPDALPRARLEHTVLRAATAAEARTLLRDAPLAGVVLEDASAADAAAVDCAEPKRDHVAITHDAPEEVRIHTRSDCPAYLVLTDTHAPGWTATVDGAPAPIHVADFALRAVRLAAGEHVIVFRYAAPGLRPGLALSILGLVIALACTLRRPRRTP